MMKMKLELQSMSPVETRAWLLFLDGGISVNCLTGNLSTETAAFLVEQMTAAGIDVKHRDVAKQAEPAAGQRGLFE